MYHTVTQQIIELLKSHNCPFETFEHEEVTTSEEAARVRPGYTLSQGAKAIIVRVKKSESEKRFLMLVMPANRRFDNDKVKRLFQVKDVRFATGAEVSAITDNVQIGGVPPFGNLFDLDIIADPTLFDNEKIVFNAGDRRFSVAMKSADYKLLAKPKIESIIQE